MEKVIDGFDSMYLISNEGCVISLKGNRKILTGKIGKNGYREVLINHKNKRKYLLVHVLVAKYFIENPNNKRTINHIDGNKLNNSVINLEWATDSENLIHARNKGLLTCCKINMEVADIIRSDTDTYRNIAKKYGLKKTQVGLIKQNKRWKR